ncbi:hypothetical protein HWV62_10977 [Athelia sp. TMB]|nr:hypothetical protein HWV62_10977 [Athelia sp. TMB]
MSSTNTDVREEGTFRFPELATYVTIKLDPVKSVEVLEDVETTASAHHAVRKVYVGYIARREGLKRFQYGDWEDDEDQEHTNYLVHLLRSGLPKSSSEEFIEKDMCTPVFPNTDHPSREPIIPSSPFPAGWTHCYHGSFETVTLRVSRKYAKNTRRIKLPLMTRAKHIAAIYEDKARRAELMQVRQGVSLAPLANVQGRAASPASSDAQKSVTTSIQSVSSQGSTNRAASLNEDDASRPVPPPIASLSYDLTSVSTLADPQDLLAEIKFIERDARARAAPRKARAKEEMARAIEEAKKLDDATFSHSFKRNPISPTHDNVPCQAEPNAVPQNVPSSTNSPNRVSIAFSDND